MRMEQTAGPAAGITCWSWPWWLLLLQTQFAPKVPVLGAGHECSGLASWGRDIHHQRPELGVQPSPIQTPPDLRHQHLSPQFIKKQLIASPTSAQVLRFLSLPADCRAVIRVCLMRFSWWGYSLSPYLPIRQRLCHSLWCQRKFFPAVFTAIQAG